MTAGVGPMSPLGDDDAAAGGGDATRPTVPPVLYLPTSGTPQDPGSSVDDGDDIGIGIELRETDDGRRALLAYTALDRLATCCGPEQPWVLYPTDRLGDLGVDYDVVYLDMVIPPELRHGRTGAR